MLIENNSTGCWFNEILAQQIARSIEAQLVIGGEHLCHQTSQFAFAVNYMIFAQVFKDL